MMSKINGSTTMITTKVMTRKIFNNILLVAALAGSAATMHAAAYEATKVQMCPGSGDTQKSYDMTMLGKTVDGYQLWWCGSTDNNGKYTYWSVDGTSLSRSQEAFSAGTKYKLVTDYSVGSSRTTPVGSNYVFITKVKSASAAELFILNTEEASTFPSDFCIAGNVTMTINDVGYNRDNNKYTQTIAWTVTGIDSKIFKEAVVQASYDEGETWDSIAASTSMTGSYTLSLDYPQAAARFRVVARPQDAYKSLARDGEWRSAESNEIEYSNLYDFRDGTFGIYNASKVIMNVGMSGSSKDIYMSLIGKTKDNKYQVWACHNTTDKTYSTVWTVDDFDKIRPTEAVSTFSNNTEYELSYIGNEAGNRYVSDNHDYVHFFVITRSGVGSVWGQYFCWDRSAELSFASKYYLNGSVTMSVSDMTYSAEKACNVQTVKWSCYDVNANAVGRVEIEASYDGGTTWKTAATLPTSFVGSTEVAVPLTASKVRYRVAVYAKDEFKVIVENGRWVSDESTDFEQTTFTVPCSFTVGNIKTNFTDGTNIYDRTYAPEVSWDIQSNGSAAVTSATLEYCAHDGDNEWIKAADLTTLTGTQNVKVPVGIDCFAFRIVPNVDESLACVSRNPSEVVVKTAEFAPAFTTFYLNGNIDDNYDAATDLLTLNFIYAMNDDLYATRQGSLVLAYSSDEGATWKVAGTTASPSRTGSITVKVSGNSLKYKFRIGIASEVNNQATCAIESFTDVYDYTPKSILVLDDTETYTPMDVEDRVVKVTRSFEANTYDTVCLPFDLSEDEIEDTFGAGTKLWEFTSGSGHFIIFNLVNSMEAGKPYIVKAGEDKEYLIIDHVDINAGTTPMERPGFDDVSLKYYYYNGTFSPITLASDGTELRMNSSGEIYTPSDATLEMNGFRAYFKLPATTTQWWKILFKDTISSIDDVINDSDEPIRVYNLRGQYLGNSLDGLPQGVYLVNDTKMVVKK